MSKGDKRRTKDISNEEFAERWDAIFAVPITIDGELTPEEKAYFQKILLEEGNFKDEDGIYRTDH